MGNNVLFKKAMVGITCFFIFAVYLITFNAIKGKEFSVPVYIFVFALLLFVIYGGAFSLFADKVAERWNHSWLMSLLMYLLGGALFPFVLSFIINSSQAIEQPDIGYKTGLLPLGLISSVVYWIINLLFSPLSKYK